MAHLRRTWMSWRSALRAGLAGGVVAVAVIAQAQTREASPVPAAAGAAGAGAADNGMFQQTCAACHGAEGRGGPGGAANLMNSPIAMADDGGRALTAFLQTGRPEKGMPPFPVTAGQGAEIWNRLRQLKLASAAEQPAAGASSVLVGDADAGRAYFNGPVGQCATCHAVEEGKASSAANLAHVASRYATPKDLQNAMVLNRSFFWSPALNKEVTATVTYRDGRTVSGYLTSVSDFKVVVRDDSGREQVIPRANGEPRVTLDDRLQYHVDMLDRLVDADMHNLTSYLATLK